MGQKPSVLCDGPERDRGAGVPPGRDCAGNDGGVCIRGRHHGDTCSEATADPPWRGGKVLMAPMYERGPVVEPGKDAQTDPLTAERSYRTGQEAPAALKRPGNLGALWNFALIGIHGLQTTRTLISRQKWLAIRRPILYPRWRI